MIEHKKFVCTDALGNANKFWEYTFDDDTSMVTVKYGRVGKTCTTDDPKSITRSKLDTLIAGKVNGRGKIGTPTYKPPYREITVVADAVALPTGPSMSRIVVAEAAKSQLVSKTDPTLIKLVDRLVTANKHELHKASGGQMDIDLVTGI